MVSPPLLPSSYRELPEKFFQNLGATNFPGIHLLNWNKHLGEQCGFDDSLWTDQKKAEVLSGQKLLPGIVPLAQAYSGHQFGHFSATLGDGRALLLAEVRDKNGRLKDIHLKGSGPTQFSRRGDGLATLRSVLRERIVSEGMFGLGIPTTQTLAVIGTGQIVQREQENPGAILVRVASSHIRVGTFEYFAARGDMDAVRQLADYAIRRHDPDLPLSPDLYVQFFQRIIKRQAELVSRWLQVGFVHGVMNTDNTAISGETLDYGPCAFMESYNPLAVWSSIDRQGRYAYARQPEIMLWNLTALGYCLVPLFAEDQQEAAERLEQQLASFNDLFRASWLKGMARKIGLKSAAANDELLIQEYMELLHKNNVDFTLGFRLLSDQEESQSKSSPMDGFFQNPETKNWLQKWRSRLVKDGDTWGQIKASMDAVNPITIPRNHLVEEALAAASEQNNWDPLNRLIQALKSPFAHQPEFSDLQKPATDQQKVSETFCGT